jgi:uncharacterized protein
MLFVLVAMDKENSAELRAKTREAHFDYAKETGAIKLGGPFLGKDGEMIGSMIIFEAKNAKAAKEWAENDPYAKAGLFEKSKIRPWKATFNPSNAAL